MAPDSTRPFHLAQTGFISLFSAPKIVPHKTSPLGPSPFLLLPFQAGSLLSRPQALSTRLEVETAFQVLVTSTWHGSGTLNVPDAQQALSGGV